MRPFCIAILAFVFVFTASIPGRAGFVQRERDGTITVVENGKFKVAPEEKDEPWIVFNIAKDTLTMVDSASKRFATGSSKEYCRMMEQLMQAMFSFMADTEKTSTAPRVKVVKEGAGGDIAGFRTTRYKIFENGQLSEEIWLTNDPTLLNELGSMKNLGFMECGTEQAGLASSPEYMKLMEKGWPLKSVSYLDDEKDVDTDVVRIEQKNVPDSEFQPPAGYKEVSFQELFEMGMEDAISEEEQMEMKQMMEEMGLDGMNIPGFAKE